MSSIVMRLVNDAAGELQNENPPFKLQQTQQFVTAAILGNGVKSFEEMTDLRIPIVFDPALAARYDKSQGNSSRDLRDDAVSQRVEKAVSRIYAKQGKTLADIDSVELQFLKLRVIDVVSSHIRKRGLCVYTQKLLFSPEFEQIGMAILKEMKQPEEQIPPSTASAAVANRLLPALPSQNLKDHLQYLSSHPMRGWGLRRKSFAQWVEEYAPTAVEFPAPNIEVGEFAREDRYSAHPYANSAQLGFGFFLATKHDQLGKLLVLTPTFFHGRRAGEEEGPWRAEFLRNQYRVEWMRPDERKRLKSVLEDLGGQSARLKACPTCSEIYSDDRDDLKLRCTCARGN